MSEALHQLLDLPGQIENLDEMLSDDGPDGSRLKAALLRVERDRTQARYINSIIDNINETALEYINDAAHHFSIIGKHLKSLSEDVQKKRPEMIVNWRELNNVSKDPLAQRVTDYSQRIDSFIKLMSLCAS
jgi:hypothetical protein